jgi:hypothetical protein
MDRLFQTVFKLLGLTFFSLILLFSSPSQVLGQTQTVPVNLPDCNSNNPEVKIISSDEDFESINDNQYRIFCVTPGTYEKIVLTRNGDSSNERYIRYYNPGLSNPNNYASPWKQTTGERAILLAIDVEASHWIIDGITIESSLYYRLVDIKNNAEHVVFNDVLMQGGRQILDIRTGKYYVIQNSVLRNSQKVPSSDSHCIIISRAKHTKILNNEIYNCAADGIHIYNGGEANIGNPEWSPEGTIIEGNEIYITPEMYADCETGALNPNGNCACAENAIDIKVTTKKDNPQEEDITQVRNNIMYGFRDATPKCACTGGSGGALAIHHPGVSHLLIENNVIFNSAHGLGIGKSGPKNISFRNNLFYDIRLDLDDIHGSWEGVLRFSYGQNIEFYNNTIIGKGNNIDIYMFHYWATGNYDFRNNLFVNAGKDNVGKTGNEGFGETSYVGCNAFIEGTIPYTNVLDPASNVEAADVELNDYCFTIHKHTNPETYCIPALPNVDSPFIDKGDPGIGNRDQEEGIIIGVNDEFPTVITDLIGNPRNDGRPDMGAFEYGGTPEPTPTSLPGTPTPIPSIPGDLDGDRDVDIFDLIIVGSHFGENVGIPCTLDPCPDTDGDGDVDIFDLITVGSHFGEGG